MRKMLEYQSDRIEAVLSQHKISGRVTGGTVTPRWIRFKVLPSIGEKISRIKGLSEEIATALDAPSVRIARQGAAVMIEVPRDEPQPVHLLPLLEHLEDIPPVTATLGIADDGAPLLIRLPSSDVGHVLISGTTGSGKTALLRTIVLSLAWMHHDPRELALVLIDPKGRAFSDLGGLPQLARPVIREQRDADDALGSLIRLMEARDRRMESVPPVVVVIDELVDLMMMSHNGEFETRLQRLVQRGRESGIHIVAATQKPTAAVIGTLVKANFPVRMAGKVSSANDARVAMGWSGTGAERLLGKGDFVAAANGKVHRFQAAFITPDETANLIRSRGWDAPEPERRRIVAAEPVQLPPPPDPEPDEREMEILGALDSLHGLVAIGKYDPRDSYSAAARLLGEARGGRRFTDVVQPAVDRLRLELAESATGGRNATATATERPSGSTESEKRCFGSGSTGSTGVIAAMHAVQGGTL